MSTITSLAVETTPSVISADVIALCERLGSGRPTFVPVQSVVGRHGWCFLNVREKIKLDKGAGLFGWNIWEYPNLYLTAEFHAVWQDPSGTLVDVTPKVDGETRIVFAVDPHYSADFDFYKRPNNRRVRIYEPKPAASLVKANIRDLSRSQRILEEQRAAENGMNLKQWVGSKASADPLCGLIDDFLQCADEADKLLTPTPDGVFCDDMDMHALLEQHKMKLLAAIKARS